MGRAAPGPRKPLEGRGTGLRKMTRPGRTSKRWLWAGVRLVSWEDIRCGGGTLGVLRLLKSCEDGDPPIRRDRFLAHRLSRRFYDAQMRQLWYMREIEAKKGVTGLAHPLPRDMNLAPGEGVVRPCLSLI